MNRKAKQKKIFKKYKGIEISKEEYFKKVRDGVYTTAIQMVVLWEMGLLSLFHLSL